MSKKVLFEDNNYKIISDYQLVAKAYKKVYEVSLGTGEAQIQYYLKHGSALVYLLTQLKTQQEAIEGLEKQKQYLLSRVTREDVCPSPENLEITGVYCHDYNTECSMCWNEHLEALEKLEDGLK